MKSFVSNRYFWIIAVVAIILLGFFLREVKLYEVPRHGATFDEFAWTWLGMNIIQTGTPVSWSPHPQYKSAQIIKHQGAYFRLVTPYLEHPPFFGIVAGGFAMLSSAREPLDVMLYHIRPLALILGTISLVLVFIFSYLIYGKGIALLSALLYATIPTIVIGSRLVQNENFFIPLWLTGLIFMYISKSKKNIAIRIAPAVIAFLLVFSKIPFMAAGISFFALYLYNKNYKMAGLMLGSTILGFFGYTIYGFYFDKELLLGLLQLQTQRYDLTFNSIFSIFEKPYLADRFFTDGWIIWGYISFFLLLIKDHKKHIFIVIPFLTYFGIYMAGIPDEPGHGWYRYPFYPFLAVTIALFIKEYFAKNHLLSFFFVAFVGTSLLQNVYAFLYGFSFIVFRAFIFMWSLIMLPLFFDNKITHRVSRSVGSLSLVILILLSIINAIIFVD